MASDDANMRDLRAKWGRHWKIWRARVGDRYTGEWMASRLDRAAGPWPTIMQPTPEKLNDALHEQAEMAGRGVPQPQPAEAGPE